MLELQNIYAGYPGKPVLQNVCLSIPTGKVSVVLGPNGCGKSTLLKTLCGILRPSAGNILLNGSNLLQLPPQQLAQQVAYLPQSRQIPDITVQRLVLHGRFPYLRYPRRYGAQDRQIASAAMEQMGLTELAHTPLHQLSGGQRQKAYLAMALAQDTPVVLLDEPTTYLDISHQLQLLSQAKALRAQGKTILMVAHDIPAALRVADHIVLMEGGHIVFQGDGQSLYASNLTEQVFGVKLQQVTTASGVHYFCEEMLAAQP